MGDLKVCYTPSLLPSTQTRDRPSHRPSRSQSIVLHNLELQHVKSTFPMALGKSSARRPLAPSPAASGFSAPLLQVADGPPRVRPSAGARITGVDDATFTAQGEPYSAVVLPNSESNVSSTLQADDVSLAYERVVRFEP